MATPFTDFAQLTQASAGATSNSGTNGDLNALLNWALPQAGWTRLYHNAGTNESVFEPTASPEVHKPCLYVRHDSAASGNAGLAVVRACESASAYNTLADPFPTVAQVGNTLCNWLVSNTASATQRDFTLNVWESGVEYISNWGGLADAYEFGFFCKPWVRISADDYSWLIGVRSNNSSAPAAMMSSATSPVPTTSGAGKLFFMRNFAGSIKSTYSLFDARSTTLGNVPGAPAILASVGSVVNKSKLCAHDLGASTSVVAANAVVMRACIPNLWAPIHSSLVGVSVTDALTDTDYNASSSFTLYKSAAAAVSGIILENTNTSDGFPGA